MLNVCVWGGGGGGEGGEIAVHCDGGDGEGKARSSDGEGTNPGLEGLQAGCSASVWRFQTSVISVDQFVGDTVHHRQFSQIFSAGRLSQLRLVSISLVSWFMDFNVPLAAQDRFRMSMNRRAL